MGQALCGGSVMVDIKAIQAQINNVSETFSKLNNYEIANKMKANDPGWQQAQKEGVEKRDHNAIVQKREENGWTEKNAGRYDNPVFRKKQSEAVKKANPALDPTKRDAWLESTREGSKQLRKPVHTPYGIFESKSEAQKTGWDIGIDFGIKLKTHPHLYYYLEDGPGETTYEKVYYMDSGCGNKLRPMHEKWCELNNEKTYANYNSWFKKMCKLYPNQFYVKTEPKREWLLYDKSPK